MYESPSMGLLGAGSSGIGNVASATTYSQTVAVDGYVAANFIAVANVGVYANVLAITTVAAVIFFYI